MIQAFYQRLCQVGKAKKLALQRACALLTILNADAEEWDAMAGDGQSAGLIFKTVADPFVSSRDFRRVNSTHPVPDGAHSDA